MTVGTLILIFLAGIVAVYFGGGKLVQANANGHWGKAQYPGDESIWLSGLLALGMALVAGGIALIIGILAVALIPHWNSPI